MITIGDSMGFHLSGQSATAETDDKLGIKDFNIGAGSLALNYHYSVLPQLQIGIFLGSETSTTEVKYKAGGKLKNEDAQSSVYLGLTYNFSDVLSDSFYVFGAIGKENYKSESKDTSDGTKSETKYDVNAFVIGFGKRFNLKGLGIENLTYSPGISYSAGKVGGDLEDGGVDELNALTLDVVKFDLLF